jgi:hypothetical protein
VTITLAGTLLGIAVALTVVRRRALGRRRRPAPGRHPHRLDRPDLCPPGSPRSPAPLGAAACRAARRATPALRTTGAGATRLDRRTRASLIVIQIAAAVVLLAGADC